MELLTLIYFFQPQDQLLPEADKNNQEIQKSQLQEEELEKMRVENSFNDKDESSNGLKLISSSNFNDNSTGMAQFKIEKLLTFPRKSVYVMHFTNFDEKENVLIILLVKIIRYYMNFML